MEIEKVDEVRYTIGKDAKKGMTTGVTLYANEALFEKIKRDDTINQAVNATTLPGIAGNVLVMPDGHEGYGLPVGGVVAFDAENGIVSPGACGYDINCLHPDARVYDANGAWHRIKDLRDCSQELISFDKSTNNIIRTRHILFLEKRSCKHVLKIKTFSGREILATPDHPILTSNGMTRAADLIKGEKVVVFGFEGVEYTAPFKRVLVSVEMIDEALARLGVTDRGNGLAQVRKHLHSLGFYSLNSQDSRLSILIRLLGLVFGDGTIPRSKRGNNYTTFYGKREDLLRVQEDITLLGFKSTIQHRQRHHRITTAYGTREFDYEENALTVSSAGFSALMVAFGAPIGNKAVQPYRVPEWLMNAEEWQKRLFLAAYFGAECSKPMVHNGLNFSPPSFSINKLIGLEDNAVAFLLDVKSMLASFGVETAPPRIVEGYRYKGKKGVSIGFRLSIMSNTGNLRRFFGNVGYAYNKKKERLASIATVFLSCLERVRNERNVVRLAAREMYQNGGSLGEIVHKLSTDNAGEGFIEHSIWEERGEARIHTFLRFDDFAKESELGESGLVYDKIDGIEDLEYDGSVFDITMDNPNHNFFANGIVVSNCGVRLIKTNLEEKDVKPKMRQLLDLLFKNVPSGVGSELKSGLNANDLEAICTEGVPYVISKGFGLPGDTEFIEENGAVAGAGFEKVSKDARARGKHEVGTLGSGNHFLEIQKVDKIFRKEVAKVYGLHEGQIVVMIHTGSRGFGHQICSDYLRTLVEYRRRKGISIVDPELAYAFVEDKEAQDYLQAMRSAINFAFVNRQVITNSVRKSFEEVLGRSADAMGMDILYDVAHNIVKLEEHMVNGKRMKLLVHRKGATRAFPKGHREVNAAYRSVGQPVLIPGSMSTASYVLCGAEGSMNETFGSSCHGAGRVMSRHQALNDIPAEKTLSTLEEKGVQIAVRSRKLISEEAEWAYKDVDDVVSVVEKAGLAGIISRNVPLGVVKG